MMRRSHPSLFIIVLSIFMAGLLIGVQIEQADAFVCGGVCIATIIAIAIGAGVGGFFLHDWLSKKSQAPGVDLNSYMDSVLDGWETSVTNLANYVRNTAIQLNAAKLYYARIAEYQAKNYVGYESLEDPEAEQGAMHDIAQDLYNLAKSTTDGFYNFLDELIDFAKNRLVGDLEPYNIFLDTENDNIAPFGHFRYAAGYRPMYAIAADDSFKAYLFGSICLSVEDADGDADADGEGDFHLTYLADNSTWDIHVTSAGFSCQHSLPSGLYEIEYTSGMAQPSHGLIDMRDILVISQISALSPGFAVFFEYQGDYRPVRWGQKIKVTGPNGYSRTIGLTHVWNAWLNTMNNIDNVYDTAFSYAKSYHQFLRNMGYTDPSQIPPYLIYPPPDVIMPTLAALYANYSERWDEIMARYLALLQEFGRTWNETNYRANQLWNELNATFADVREKFLNVVIRMANGTMWAAVEELIPLWVSKAQEFYANQTATLEGVMGALVKFSNGTWRYVEIPAGWQITPGSIMTPKGSQPSLYLQNWAGGYNPAYTPGNHTQPNFLEPASEELMAALKIMFSIVPLILLLAVVRMIMNLGKWR